MNASKTQSYNRDAEIGMIRIRQRLEREHAARRYAREQFEREARLYRYSTALGAMAIVLMTILAYL